VRLVIRTGINTGEVVTGDPAIGDALVLGDAVNVAARLEQAAPPGEVLLGQATYRLVRDAVEVERMAPLTLKGKQAPVAAWRLLEVDPGAPGHARRQDAPIVGREAELRLFAWVYERVRGTGSCHLLTVLGQAGVGKTRLVTEAVRGLADATVLRGRCLSYGEGITYWPVEEVVRQAAGVADRDPPAEATAKLRRLLGDAEDAGHVAGRVAQLIGLEAAPVPAEEAAWAFRRLLETLAGRGPLVVVLDDLHWAEPTLLDLVEHVADFVRAAPILLVAMARPELLEQRPGWAGGKLSATTLLLEPLGQDESAELLASLAGPVPLPEAAPGGALAAIATAAAGDPRLGAHATVARLRMQVAVATDLDGEELQAEARPAIATFAAAAVMAGDPAAAERHLRWAIRVLERQSESGLRPNLIADLAHVLHELGQHKEALWQARVSRDLTARDDLYAQIRWRGAAAKALAAEGRPEEAARLAAEAVTIAGPTDVPAMRGDALLDLATVALAAGRGDDAAAAARSALALYRAKGRLPGAARASAAAAAAAAMAPSPAAADA
jgi:AAA ATPase domain/Adenylate and Guanylate cyclase catalytic domain